jgi:multidrug efflux pump subunit AcrB
MTSAAAIPKHLGFVALLGVLALIGVIACNSVILFDQVEKEKAQGRYPWDASACMGSRRTSTWSACSRRTSRSPPVWSIP